MLALLAVMLASEGAALITPSFHRRSSCTTSLSMGLLDSISSFIKKREGDFVKLEDSGTAIGSGPLLLLFNLPQTIQIDDEEFVDMVEDGAPKASEKGVVISRISVNDASVLDMPLSNALEKIVRDKGLEGDGNSDTRTFDSTKCSVLYFSGFPNDSEMMETYNIIGKEIYEESGGSVSPACAKAVVNAMEKPLRQVLDEISGDHEEAMSSE